MIRDVLPALAALLLLPAGAVLAQSPATELQLFELDEALARETTIASRKPRTIRETPGVVTVLTRDAILASGARDLADVLLGVPGFQLALDVAGTLGFGFRGVWGHEGKILVLVDGIELNDLLYGAVPFGNHVLVDEIERVEVIRGPGSVQYGGNAELAVVHVFTRGEGLGRTGGAVTLTGARMSRAFSAGTATVAAAGGRGGLRGSIAASAGTGARSERTYLDLSGGRFDMAGDSRLTPVQVNAAVRHGGASLRVLFDDYRYESRDGYGDVLPAALDLSWRTLGAEARWELHATDRLRITPRIGWKRQSPWRMADAGADPDSFYDVTAERLSGGVAVAWDPTAAASFVAGADSAWDRAWSNQPGVAELEFDGRRQVSHGWAAVFAEAGVDTPAANVLAGVRLEDHSEAGTAVVPRLALTRLAPPFHLKLLASSAFRAPSIENLHYGEGIRPERLRIYEAELGIQRGPLYAAANVFELSLERPIVFGLDAEGADVYVNGPRTGSAGAEGEVRVESPVGTVAATYAYYLARGRNRVPAYAVETDGARLLGFAGHVAAARATLRLGRGLTVTPEARWTSERHAVVALDAAGAPVVGRLPARAVVNVFATWSPARFPGLELGAGARDVLDAGTVYPQPYRTGGHAPLPGPSRELSFRLRWQTVGGP